MKSLKDHPFPTSHSQITLHHHSPVIPKHYLHYIPSKWQHSFLQMKKYGTFSPSFPFSPDSPSPTNPSFTKNYKALHAFHLNFTKTPKLDDSLTIRPPTPKKLKLYQYTGLELCKLAKNLKAAKSLHSLTITLENYKLIGKQGFYNLCKQLSKLKSIKSLELHLQWAHIHPHELHALSRFILSHHLLNRLVISLQSDETTLASLFSALHKRLDSYKNLQSLELSAKDHFEFVQERQSAKFYSKISKLTGLDSLKLKFVACGISQESIGQLERCLQSLPNLHTVDLTIRSCSRIQKERIETAILALKDIQTLRCLYLDIGWSFSENQLVWSLSETIPALQNLQQFALDVRGTKQIEPGSFGDLISRLSTCQHLTHLSLNFGQDIFPSDQDILGLSRLTNLTVLRLLFDGCKLLNDDPVISVATAISSLTKLESLVLIIHQSRLLTDNSLEQISNIFPHLPHLKALRLHLYMCKGITNRGFEPLTVALAGLTELEQLNLNFSWTSLDGEVIQGLASSMINMKKLKTISLFFYACPMGDEYFGDLGQVIGGMEVLETLRLEFGGCEIGRKGLRNMGDYIGEVKRLRDLHLNFSQCKEIGDSAVEQLCYKVKEMKGLRSLKLDFEGSISSKFSKKNIKMVTDSLPVLGSFVFITTPENNYE